MAKLPIKNVAQRKLEEALERLKEQKGDNKTKPSKKDRRSGKDRRPKREDAPG